VKKPLLDGLENIFPVSTIWFNPLRFLLMEYIAVFSALVTDAVKYIFWMLLSPPVEAISQVSQLCNPDIISNKIIQIYNFIKSFLKFVLSNIERQLCRKNFPQNFHFFEKKLKIL